MIPVLISSDNRLFRQTCPSVFSMHGYETRLVEKKGSQVLDAYRFQPADIVVMEAFMPEMDAISVMNAVQDDEALPFPYFFITSTFYNPPLVELLKKNGAVEALAQPISAEELLGRINHFVHTKCNFFAREERRNLLKKNWKR